MVVLAVVAAHVRLVAVAVLEGMVVASDHAAEVGVACFCSWCGY